MPTARSSIGEREANGSPPCDLVPRAAATASAGAVAAPESHANELVQRLAALVQNAPARRGPEDEIIAEELARALDNIRLRTALAGKGVLVAAGPEGGEYWRFMSSVVTRVGGRRADRRSPRAPAASRTHS